MEAKKEHFVPQFYLRRFANDDRLNVYDKALGRSFGAHIRDVASERFFYDLPQLDEFAGTSQALEKHFHPFEEAGAAAIRFLVERAERTRGFHIPRDIRLDLSLYLALQHLRTRETREVIVQTGDGVARELFLDRIRKQFPEISIKREWLDLESTEERRRGLHALVLLDEEIRVRIAASFSHCWWVVLRNKTPQPFYTSDQPVAHHNGVIGKPLGSPKVGAVGSEIAFPLAPGLLLVMFERTAYPHARKQDGRVSDMVDPQHVEYYNSLQVLYSYRQIYSVQSEFALAADMLAESPAMADTKFERIGLRLGLGE